MGTTKDPEGFRRHSAGRRQVLGNRPQDSARRRGCGLGLALFLLALGLGTAALWLRGERGSSGIDSAASAVGPAGAIGPRSELAAVSDDAAPERPGATALLQEPDQDERFEPGGSTSRAPVGAAAERTEARIRLLRGWSDAPLADAQVLWISGSGLERRKRDGLVVTTARLEPLLHSIGTHATSDAEGVLHVAADECHLLVLGDGWTRELQVRAHREAPVDARVFTSRALTIDVVDCRGAPVPAIDVEVWRLDAQGEPRLLHRTLRSSASRGSVRVDDVDAVWQSGLEADLSRRRGFDGELKHPDLPDLERTRLRVALARDLAPSAWAEIDLALDPLPHVTLRFPPLGELRVTVADAGGNPVSWAGGVELRAEGPRDATFSRELVDGRAEFTTLPFHTAFLAHAVRSDGARGEAVRVAPFAHDEPVREHVLPDVAAQARLRARPIHPDGFALPRTWCEVRFVSPRPAPEPEPTRSDTVVSQLQVQALRELGYTEEPSGRLDGVTRRIRSMPYRTAPKASESPAAHELRRVWTTDETGFLDVPLPAGLQELRDVTVFVSLVRDGRTLSSEPIRFQRGAAWGDLDLGPVPLLGPEPESEKVK